MGEQKRKRAKDATPEENLPGSIQPLQTKIGNAMPGIMELLESLLGGCGITLFVTEEGRFNYVSNQDRADMVAMLTAFVAKNADLAKQEEFAKMPIKGGTQ